MLSEEIQDLILQYRNTNPQEAALKISKKGISSTFIIQQIEGWQKAKDKLPTWHNTKNIIFPVRLSMEQCSSESTANYKALITKGSKLADLTAGFGVDSFAFTKSFENVIYIEQNKELFEIAKHNFESLNIHNIECINTNGIDYLLRSTEDFNCVFIDPARRNEKGIKIFQLNDCEPNILDQLDEILGKTKTLMVKTSPLLDIDKTISDLKFVKEVHVISVNNECKEVLYLIEKNWIGQEKIVAVNLTKGKNSPFEFYRNDEKNAEIRYSDPLSYVYEPNSSILKSGAFKYIAKTYNIFKLAPNTHLYTSDELISEFPGRIFKTKTLLKESEVKKMLMNGTANVMTRNYSLTADQLRVKLKIKDGGTDFIIGCKTNENKPIILLTEKII